MALKNKLSYSNSRANLYNDGCLRQYYLQYYGSWDGWNRRASKEKQEAFFLKKLTGIYAWIGTIVHDAIAEFLRNFKATGRILTPEQVKAKAYSRMKADWATSQSRTKKRMYKMFGLKEHEYKMPISDQVKKSLKATLLTSIDTFFSSDLFNEILETPTENWLYIDDDSFPTFKVDTDRGVVDAFSIPDFAMKRANGRVLIVDWKTGKQKDEHLDQVALYAKYAVDKWGVKPDEVDVCIFYNKTGQTVEATITQDDVDKADKSINDFIVDISKKLQGEDIDKNAPLKKDGKDDLSIWPLTDDTSNCRWCNFEKICGIKEK